MLQAKHQPFIYGFFRVLGHYLLRSKFKTINIIGKHEHKPKAILVLANHISWWDGFFISYLNDTRLKRLFHVMMEHKQLKKYLFFNLCGAFSVQKGNRSITDTIHYTASLLQNSKNMVLLFPQGKITSVYNSHIKFEKGADSLLKLAGIENIQILFIVNCIDYGSYYKPTVSMYIKEYTPQPSDSLQQAYQLFYNDCLKSQLKNTP